MTKEQVREWLLGYAWLGTREEQEREVECILAQDGWRYTDALADKYAGAQMAELEALEYELLDRHTEADREMAEMAAVGNATHRAQKAGVCCHMSAAGYLAEPVYPEQNGLKPGQLRCTEGCGQVFGSDEEWYLAMDFAIEGR